MLASPFPRYRLSLCGRSIVLILLEILFNVICWIVAVILFAESKHTQSITSLALLAWTLGLRHGKFQSRNARTSSTSNDASALDADHIRFGQFNDRKTAIDNATRGLIGFGQLPVTCGLFFSFGHSTIVIAVTIAIAISSSVYNRLHNVGDVGGIIGAAVSGSFLFIIAVVNSALLWKTLKQRRKKDSAGDDGRKQGGMIMMRLLGPIMTFVDRPWKMYPVGLLFGLGFDTASSIALLAISAVAQKKADDTSVPSSHIIVFPFLFTAGMSLIDSLDSILMLYSYSGFPENKWTLLEQRVSPARSVETSQDKELTLGLPVEGLDHTGAVETRDPPVTPNARAKMNTMSRFGIILTLMSVLVAFSISLITIMGLIGEQCRKCAAAAQATDGGGLAGSWWRAWARANDNSSYVGAAIVGTFLLMVLGWYGMRMAIRLMKGRHEEGIDHA